MMNQMTICDRNETPNGSQKPLPSRKNNKPKRELIAKVNPRDLANVVIIHRY